jgi:micrococcal nuclease
MERDLWWYRAKALRVKDGDTILFEIDKGMHDRSEESIRVAGVDTPELFTGTDRERGGMAKAFTEEWVAFRNIGRWPFLLRTYKDTTTFGRYVADVYDAEFGGSLADAIQEAGFSNSLT